MKQPVAILGGVSRGTLLQVCLPLLAVGVVVLVLRARGLSPRRELALQPVLPATLLRWVAVFVVLVLVEELVGPLLGSPPVEPWGTRYGLLERIVRVAGMIVAAPVAEELMFRGLLFSRLSRTRLGVAGAVVATAALFAVLHVQYGFPELGFILVDGVFFGVARAATGSVLVPLACHVLGNAYAAFERLAG